jgi:hypothetical protein
MKATFSTLLGLVAVVALMASLQAADKADKADKKGKEVTLKGTITCAKCDLKVADKCATVLVVKEEGKDVVYYLDTKSAKANHKTICQSPMMGSVTGTVSKEGDKHIITASKVDFDSK